VREPKGRSAGAHPKHARGAVRLPRRLAVAIFVLALVYSTEGTWRPEAHKGDGRRAYTVEVSPAD